MKNKKVSGIIKPFLIPTLIVAGIAISITAGYTLSINSKVDKWGEKIYPGITIQGIDVSEKNKEEATELLTKELQQINNKNITVKANSKEFKLNLKSIAPKYNIEESVEIALMTGKDESIFRRNDWINSKNKKDIDAHCTYNADKMEEFKKQVKKGVNIEPKNATIKKSGEGKFDIVDGSNGYTLDEESFDESINKSIINTDFKDEEVKVEMKETEPKVKKETLSKIDGVLGSFSTKYDASNVNRSYNLKLATASCNGKVIMPAEVFSYNETLGPREGTGYKEAYVFTDGKVEKGVGGGICQVSSTLYRAAMRANLRSVERTNHMFPVDYAELGKDATVAWGAVDYKFKNGYESPIYIEAYLANSMVYFNIYGNTKEKGSKTYDIVTDKPVKVKNQTKVNSYFVTYENGKQVKSEFIRTDIYKEAPPH